jgi:solute carrier family 25 carnitine/acylcarnitine transporter 20/29
MSSGASSSYNFKDFIVSNMSGGLAGGLGVAFGIPFDIVKIRMQTFPDIYKSSMSTLMSIIRTEGITRGLYKGSLVPIFTIIPSNALAFSGEDVMRYVFKRYYYKEGEDVGPIASYFAGIFGGIMQCLVLVPAEVVKCNMQVDNVFNKSPKYTGNLHCVRDIYSKEGIKGLYKGTGVTIIRDAPGFGVYFAAYRAFTEPFAVEVLDPSSPTGSAKKSKVPEWAVMVGGGLAGCCSWGSIYPFDVIKSHIQIDSARGARTTTWSMGKQLYRKYGAGIFFKGIGPTLTRAFPVNAITFYCNDLFKEHIFA